MSSSSGPAAYAVFTAAGSLRIFWASPAPLACGGSWALHPVSGCSSCGVVCLVCRWGSPAAFSFLRVGVLLAKVSPEFVGCEGGLGCPSWFIILFLCLLVLHLFLELGCFWSHVGGPSCDSWFWSLLMPGYTFLTP